jgi:hypothetical protein
MNKTTYGKQTYLNVIGAGTAMIGITYGLARYSYGLFLPYIQRSLNIDIFWLGFLRVIATNLSIGCCISTIKTTFDHWSFTFLC